MQAAAELSTQWNRLSVQRSETACLCDNSLPKVASEGRRTRVSDRSVQVHNDRSILTCRHLSTFTPCSCWLCSERRQTQVGAVQNLTLWPLVDVGLKHRRGVKQINCILHGSTRAGVALCSTIQNRPTTTALTAAHS